MNKSDFILIISETIFMIIIIAYSIIHTKIYWWRQAKPNKQKKKSTNSPYGEIMDPSEEFVIYERICSSKKVCTRCSKCKDLCVNCVFRHTNNNSYGVWKKHIINRLSKAKTTEHLKNFRQYIFNMQRNNLHKKGLSKDMIVFATAPILSIVLNETILNSYNPIVKLYTAALLILFTAAFVCFIKKYEDLEADFYEDIVSITDNYINDIE